MMGAGSTFTKVNRVTVTVPPNHAPQADALRAARLWQRSHYLAACGGSARLSTAGGGHQLAKSQVGLVSTKGVVS